ncbi:hypothetical protein D5086_025687 [Populus alba]|uniref:Uncharacterized protein n=1 Tax=Populus alba TaxID=43335 RepID=A0ACC4AZW2_POPAL
MKSLESRETAFGFFKFAFQDDSDEIVKSSCVAAHVLGAQNLKFLAQDVVSWVIRRVGVDRSRDVVEFMWKRHAEFESDFSVLDTLMRGFLKVEMGCEALEIVGRMREVGLRPSSSAITILFKLLLRVGDHGSVWKLLRGMIHQGPRPCNRNFNAVILGFCRKGHVKVGESLLCVMQKFKCQPDVYAYNILINAYCTRGQTVDALGWMRFMIDNGCTPSLVTFGTVINAFCNQGNMMEARNLFDGMKEAGHIPNVVCYNTLMNGYVKARDIGQANMLYEEMKSKAIAPDFSTDEVVNKMHATGWDPDITTYNIRLHGLCTGRKMSRAVMMLEELISAGVVPDTVTYNTVMNGVCTDILERAMIVTAKLLKMAFVPNVVTANLLLSHFCKQGMPEKTIMWGQKLNEISFGFDEISIKLMDRAYRNIQDNVDIPKPPPEKSLFLDFLILLDGFPGLQFSRCAKNLVWKQNLMASDIWMHLSAFYGFAAATSQGEKVVVAYLLHYAPLCPPVLSILLY